MISIFTPTHNRAYILGNLYKSLQKQTSYEFEWIIVDDDSTDGTEELVRSWMQDTREFPIIYKKVPHGGKHRAINCGVELARYEAFFIVDSDDFLSEDAVWFVNMEFSKIKDNDLYAGISGLRGFHDGTVIGQLPTFEDYVDATNFERAEYGLLGDKAEVYKKSVLKKHPFPEFEGETFLTECVVWDAIAFEGLKIRWFNKVIYYTEYLPDGLSKNMYQKMKENPFGYAERIRREIFYGKLTGEILSETLFKFMERSNLSKDTVCKLFNITEEDYNCILQRKKRIAVKLQSEIQNHGIKNMALYGYGNNAHRLMGYIDDMDVKIPYVIDRNYGIIRERPAYSLDMELPEVEGVCITLGKPEPELKYILKKKLPNAYIWQLKDIVANEW